MIDPSQGHRGIAGTCVLLLLASVCSRSLREISNIELATMGMLGKMQSA
jgi:hypothetical protein